MTVVSAEQVANELRHLALCDGDRRFTAWKLQKLLYQSQRWSLATRGRAIFYEQIKAWRDGPAVPAVWHAFKGRERVPLKDIPESGLDDDDRELIHGVWQMYGHLKGEELRDLSHSDSAFKEARMGLANDEPGSSPISRETMAQDVKGEIVAVNADADQLLASMVG